MAFHFHFHFHFHCENVEPLNGPTVVKVRGTDFYSFVECAYP